MAHVRVVVKWIDRLIDRRVEMEHSELVEKRKEQALEAVKACFGC
jgi:hypothetical protein